MPLDVLEEAQRDFLDYNGSGMSIVEMSHRSKTFMAVNDEANALLRELMNVPDNYSILFVQGGASQQFAAVPLNLMVSGKADYIVTGNFAGKAQQEALKYGDARIIASSKDKNFTYIPDVDKISYNADADYVHITTNNTIFGTRYTKFPKTDKPLVADMSSNILSEEIDVSRFGMIWAGAQKNVGPAGVTIVIVREDLIGFAGAEVPTYLDYKIHADNGSMYNTPPCFSIYVAGEVFKYLKSIGGIAEMERRNKEKAQMLYDFIDSSRLFSCPVAKEDRSLMNVVFVTGDAELDKKFIALAKENGMINLSGHRSIGGMRASIYNAMPKEGVAALVDFMRKFEEENK